MKQTLLQRISLRATLLVALMCAAFTGVRAAEVTETITFSEQGYTNAQAIESYEGKAFTITFDKGSNSNAPTYYNTGTAIRAYGGNTFTVSSVNTITKIVLGFGSNDGTNEITADPGTFTTPTWTGSASEVTFTISGTKGNRRIASVTVTYEGASVVEKVAEPTFSVEAGVYTQAQRVELSTTTEGATIYYTTDGTEPTVNSTQYTGAISVGQTMTINAIAVKEGMDNSSVATATYKFPVIEHAGTEADPYTVADARAAIDLNTGLTGVYVIGTVSNIVTKYNSTYGNVTFDLVDQEGDTETLRAYRCSVTSADAVKVGDVVTVTGDLTLYNEIYEFEQGCTLVTPPVPTVTVDQTELNVTAAEANGTIAVTYNNISNVVAEVQFFDATGASATYDWIAADIDADNNIYYVIEANTGEERTAYMKVYALDDETNDVYSEVITVTQAAPLLSITLPFAFNGGRADIAKIDGLTQSGLGTDYKAAPLLKFDNTGDELVMKFDAVPAFITFDIKGNGFEGGTFAVHYSNDGESYRHYDNYVNLDGTVESHLISGLPADTRYVKWVYTEKVTGNVGLGNIRAKAAFDYTRAVTAGNYGTICLPYDAVVEGAELYSIASKDAAATSISLSEETAIKAGVPYIFKATAANFNAAYTSDTEATEASAANGLVGSFEGTAVAAGNYVIKNNAVCPAGDGVTIGANKAYINLTDVPASSTTGSVKLFINGDADAISAINAESRNEAIYNVAGQRLQKVQKGVNIVGGKKIVVK